MIGTLNILQFIHIMEYYASLQAICSQIFNDMRKCSQLQGHSSRIQICIFIIAYMYVCVCVRTHI